MRRLFVSMLGLALALPAGLAAQESNDAEERIAEAFATAEAAGVPLEMLKAKQAEGLAKGVSIELLADAMARRADALVAAREAMPGSDAHALAAGADAVEAGIGGDVLAFIEATVPGDRRFVAVFALSRLAALEYTPAEALQIVDDALNRGPQAVADVALGADAALARRGPPEAFGPSLIPAFAGPPGGLPVPGSLPSGPPTGIPVGGVPGGG